MSRFRNTVLNVSVPAAVESAYQASMNRRASTATASSPAADSGEAALSASGVASLAHAPAAVGERLAQVAGSAARNSMKFLSRFLPGSAEKEGTGTLTRNVSASLTASGGVGGSDGHSPLPSQPLQRKSSRLAPLHVLSPQSGGAGGGVFSDSSSSSGSCGGASAEDFTLFKQTSIEIQLRLTAALEDADKRAHSLLVSYQHEEEKTRSQAEQMQRMQAQIEELQRQNQELQAATAAVSAASSASGTAPASAASSVAPAAPTAVPDDSFSTSPCIQVTPRARVRRARAEDVVHMDAMIRELALYERAPEAVVGTADMLAECLFGPNPRLHAHVLEVLDDDGDDGAQDASAAAADGSANGSDDAATSNTRTGEWRVQGMAIWFLTYSTWLARHGIWLEDLYVRPAYRGGGMGRALLRALASECVTRGYQRLDWYVLDWNEPAHKAYRAIGAAPLDEWSLWRLEGDKLDKFGTEVPTTKSASPPVAEAEAAASISLEANSESLAAAPVAAVLPGE
jgi:GNAT superfamily N-acetyltransferase